MENNKTKKYFILGVIGILLISLLLGIKLFKNKPKEEKEKTISKEKTKSMLSYTLDGQKTDIKPTKESGYIANKIICENGSNLIWDNTNWEVEIISLESNDVCSIDFTTNTSSLGYRVSATTNVEGSIDSLSKATIENGKVIFYPNKGQEITSVSGCTGKLENNKVVVSNITSNQTCNIEVKIPLKTLYATLTDSTKYNQSIRSNFRTPVGGTSITQGYNSTKIIYKVTENSIDHYYFAGNPSDNWVKFVDKWWRIIRTNSSEGTRLLYAGSAPDAQDGYINNTKYQWNNSCDLSNNIEWNNASLKTIINSWYSDNITEVNDNMVNFIQYCNDTSLNEIKGLTKNYTPSYSCTTNSFGSSAKVGLMTASEVGFAGGVYNKLAPNTYYYRNSLISDCTGTQGDPCSVTGNNYWWTLTPWDIPGMCAYGTYVCGAGDCSGDFGYVCVTGQYSVRPVITLKPEVKVSGSGTTEDPFIPSL